MNFKISAAAAALLLSMPFAAHAAGDVAKGEAVFKKCKICHQVGPEAKTTATGPAQNDLFGRKAGTVEGFKYSDALKEAGEKGLTWTEENVDKYLADPKGFIPKNKMAFAGLKDAQERADVIAYLKTFSK